MPTIHNSSRPPGSSSSTQVPFPRRKRFTILFISVSLFLFHLILSSKLSGLTTSLRVLVSIDGDEEEEEEDEYYEGGRLRAVRGIVTLLGIARFWSLCSAGIALVGIYSIHKSNLSLLRLFTLNTFLSIFLDCFLLTLTFILLSFTSSNNNINNKSSSSIVTTICQTLSNQNGGSNRVGNFFNLLPDLLGLSLEQCEEKFEQRDDDDSNGGNSFDIVSKLLGIVFLIEGLRIFSGYKLLNYYTLLVKTARGGGRNTTGNNGYEPIRMMMSNSSAIVGGERKKRRSSSSSGKGRANLRIDTTSFRTGERYFDSPEDDNNDFDEEALVESPKGKGKGRERERESSSNSNSGNKRGSNTRGGGEDRILVLSRPRSDSGEVPLLSLTPSTPNRTSFPPPSASSSSPKVLPSSSSVATAKNRNGRRKSDSDSERKILVYQPIMMTIEEARQQGVSEVQLSTSSPRRTRSLSQQQQQHTHRSFSSPKTSTPDRRSRSSTITVKTSSNGNSNPSIPSVGGVPVPPPSPVPSSASSRTIRRQDSIGSNLEEDEDTLPTPTRTTRENGNSPLLRVDESGDDTLRNSSSSFKKRA